MERCRLGVCGSSVEIFVYRCGIAFCALLDLGGAIEVQMGSAEAPAYHGASPVSLGRYLALGYGRYGPHRNANRKPQGLQQVAFDAHVNCRLGL